MASDESFRPDWTSAPSDTIREVLADRGIRPVELAAELGETMDVVTALLDGRSAITLGTARSLSAFLGGSVVCRACLAAWRCESSAQPDGGEVLAKRKGAAARRGLEEA